MNTNKNSYTVIYAIAMVIVVALLLAIVSGSLKDRQTANVNMDKKKQILVAININTDGKDVNKVYEQYIKDSYVINTQGKRIENPKTEAFYIEMKREFAKTETERHLPIYVAEVEGKIKYIFTVYGTGLWGPIWGYISLNDNKNSIYGTYYSHAGETPGLGAEIATTHFQQEFVGKNILNKNNKFVSIAIVKPGKEDKNRDYVDGISGGTITSKGVETMLFNSLKQYEAFLTSFKEKGEKNE